MRSPCAPRREYLLPKLEKSLHSNEDLAQPKINKNFKLFFFKKEEGDMDTMKITKHGHKTTGPFLLWLTPDHLLLKTSNFTSSRPGLFPDSPNGILGCCTQVVHKFFNLVFLLSFLMPMWYYYTCIQPSNHVHFIHLIPQACQVVNLIPPFFFFFLIGLTMRHVESQFPVVVHRCSVAIIFDLMDRSTPVFPVLHYLLEFAQIHVSWVDDAI